MQNDCKCISTTVSFRGLCEDRKDCLAYVDDVIGITAEMPALLVDDLNPTPEEVITKVINSSAMDFGEFVKAKVGAKFTERTIFRDGFTGYWNTPHEAIAAEAGKLRGVFISLEESPYLYINVGSVELYTVANGLAGEKIRIIDLDRGTEIESFSFDASASAGKFTTVDIGKKYFGYRRIFIGYRSELSSLKIVNYGRSHYSRLCRPCRCGTSAQCATISASGVMTYDTADFGQDCGLRVCYGIGCSLEGWICNNKARFAEAFKYSVAAHLLEEVIGSDKLNRVTNMDEDKLETIYAKVTSRMDRIVKNIVKGSSFDCKFCFPCAKKSRTKKTYFSPLK